MTTYSRGDIVLVGFVFSEENGRKLRPALVVSSARYHRDRRDVIVAKLGVMSDNHVEAVSDALRDSMAL